MHYDIEHTSVYYAARENAEIARFLRANGRYRRFNAGAGSGIVIRVTGNDSLLNTSTYCTEQYYSENSFVSRWYVVFRNHAGTGPAVSSASVGC